jgi:uncharacterized spore protein YtfJ
VRKPANALTVRLSFAFMITLDPGWCSPSGAWCSRENEEDLDMDVEDLLAKVSDNLSVHRAFGTAYERGGVLIIPVALVAGGGGAGTGRAHRGGPASGPDPSSERNPAVSGTAPQDSGPIETGGGFGGLVLPVGAYVVKGDQVRWIPAVDVTLVVLASLSLVRAFARMGTRSRRRR